MTDEFGALLAATAPAEPPRPKRGRPTREEAERRRAEAAAAVSAGNAARGRAMDDIGGIGELLRPVTQATLAQLFRMDPKTVRRRLARCPHRREGQRFLYDFREACGFLVTPKMTTEEFIRTLNSSHLPPEINKAFWDGQRSRVKYKIEAQEAWETEDVLDVLGDAFMTVKDTLTMLVEDLRERARLTPEQAAAAEETIDGLRDTLRQKLVEMPAKKQSGAMFAKPLFGRPEELLDDEALGEERENG